MFLQACVILFTRGVLSQHALQVVSQHALQQVSWGCLVPGGVCSWGVWSRGGLVLGVPAPRGCGLLLWPSVVVFCYAFCYGLLIEGDLWYGLLGGQKATIPEGDYTRPPHQKATIPEGHYTRRPPHQKAITVAWWRPPPHPPGWLLLWAVCILLECILVVQIFPVLLRYISFLYLLKFIYINTIKVSKCLFQH